MRTRMIVIALAALCGACVRPVGQARGLNNQPLDGRWAGRESLSVNGFREWHLTIKPENVQTLRVERVVPGKGYYVNENAHRCDVSFIVTLDTPASRAEAHPRVSLAVAGMNGECASRRFTFYGVQLDPRTMSGELREQGGEFTQLALTRD